MDTLMSPASSERASRNSICWKAAQYPRTPLSAATPTLTASTANTNFALAAPRSRHASLADSRHEANRRKSISVAHRFAAHRKSPVRLGRTGLGLMSRKETDD